MTATPIPRSLALTLWGDLDLSVITQLPKGRRKIITKIVTEKTEKKLINLLKKKLKKAGRHL